MLWNIYFSFLLNYKYESCCLVWQVGVVLDPGVHGWISITWISWWVSIDWAFGVAPWDITQEFLLTILHSGQWSAGVTHAWGDAISWGTLLTRSQCLCTPDLLALGNGDAVDVSPLHSGGNDTLIFSLSRVHLMGYLEALEKSGCFQIFRDSRMTKILTVRVFEVHKISP